MSTWINKVVERQDLWVRLINSYGESFYADDIVQEFYIKLHKHSNENKALINGELNMSYLSTSLRNIYYNHYNKKKKVEFVRIGEGFEIEDVGTTPEDYLTQDALKRIDQKITDHIKTWRWYDGMLYDIHINQKIPMRVIARGSKISLSSIFHTLKRLKKDMSVFMETEIAKDIENYNEGNYELI